MTMANDGSRSLPHDSHVHTEWSWDAVAGSMARSCARALELGLQAIAFTEHVDLTPWRLSEQLKSQLPEHFLRWVGNGDVLEAPELDVAGYLECVERCRERFPELLILTGVELSEPHWHPTRTAELLSSTNFDRILGSVHSVPSDSGYALINELYYTHTPTEVVKNYLEETLRLVESTADFTVLAHIDYPIRSWPVQAGVAHPRMFEDEYRAVLRTLARSGRVLEVNTKVPLHAEIVHWWYQAGGPAVSFGSDAHNPTRLAHGFADAQAMVEAAGFRPCSAPDAFWTRR
ncbi:PHP domain-containing protein [Gandjariella thermophila]|uniref:Histidinol-phosphatase n=1 Tax=Gandjariella thermophila TaxID=1931992 RepID=A0A4D4JGQ4_9PSEU|nr:PHP domain-containing protein [Gandjariella thermophila]GDY33818.1 histidinol-phosphatase [Gandjariella thermophila]